MFNAFAIASVTGMFFGGQLADRHVSQERYLALSHLVGGLAIMGLAYVKAFWPFFGLMLLHCFFYVPTLSVANAIAFAHVADGKKEFGFVRLWGSVGWVAAAWPLVFIPIDWAKVPSMAQAGGFFAWLSYIAPLLTDVTHFHANTIPLIMTAVGVGMTVGVNVGGKLADRVPPLTAIIILLTTMVALLCMNALLASSQPAMMVLAFAVGANALALGPPIQMLLIEHSREAEMLGSSLGQSGFNIGNALGAFLGGIPLTLGYSYASPQWVAASLALSGVVLALAMRAHGRRVAVAVPA